MLTEKQINNTYRQIAFMVYNVGTIKYPPLFVADYCKVKVI